MYDELEALGLEAGLVLADLDDLINLVGNPFAPPNLEGGAGVPGVPNELEQKMEYGDDQTNPNNNNNNGNGSSGNSKSDSQGDQNSQDSQGGQGGGSQGSNSQNSNGGSQSGSSSDLQNSSPSGQQGGQQSGSQGGSQGGLGSSLSEQLKDKLKNMVDGGSNNGGDKGSDKGGSQGGSQDSDSEDSQSGSQGGSKGSDKGGSQSGSQGGLQGGSQSSDNGGDNEDSQGGSQGGDKGGSQGDSQGSGTEFGGTTDGGESDDSASNGPSGNSADSGSASDSSSSDGNAQGGASDGGYTDDPHSTVGSNMWEDEDEDTEQSSFFGDDLEESKEDFQKRMQATERAHGSGAGSHRKVANFRGLNIDLDEYAHSAGADIFAQDVKGDDENVKNIKKDSARKIENEARALIDHKIQAAEIQAEADAEMDEAEKKARQQAAERGKGMSKSLFNSQGCVEWKPWLRKHMAAHFEITDLTTHGHPKSGGYQAFFQENDMFYQDEVRTKVHTGLHIELFFDTSGSISESDMATFFREVAIIMREAKCQIMRTPHTQTKWNKNVDLYIYCWDGSVLCNAHVKTPEELMEVARKTYGGGGTDPNCIFKFKQYNDGLRVLPATQQSNTGVVYLDNMTPKQYKKYLEAREKRLGKTPKSKTKAINQTLTIVFTDYGFGAVRENWWRNTREWHKMLQDDNHPGKSTLLWVCLPGCVNSYQRARELTPIGDICLMDDVKNG